MHNKYTLPVTLNEVKGLKKDSTKLEFSFLILSFIETFSQEVRYIKK